MENMKSFTETKEFKDYKLKIEKLTHDFFESLAATTRECAHDIVLGLFEKTEESKRKTVVVDAHAKRQKKIADNATKKAHKVKKRPPKKNQKDARKAWYLRNKQRTNQKLSETEQAWLNEYTKKHPLKVQKVK